MRERSRSLVLAPHPDDEVLGCGGLIAKKISAGDEVLIVFLTDGRRGVPAPPEEARARREEEAVRAASVLGLDRRSLVFLRFEDGRLGESIPGAAQQIRELVVSEGVDQLFLPYRREYHPDHVAGYAIGRQSAPRGVRIFEYPIWYGLWLWRRLGWRARAAALCHLVDALRAVKVPIDDVVELKRRALAEYRSQLDGFSAQGPWGDAYLEHFLGAFETFFVG